LRQEQIWRGRFETRLHEAGPTPEERQQMVNDILEVVRVAQHRFVDDEHLDAVMPKEELKEQ